MSHRRKTDDQESSPKLTLPVSEGRDHIEGGSKAKVTLVEYGDYQCPYCGQAYPIVKKVQEKYKNRLRFVFRNFPLTEIHPRAEFGAEMAEASGAQGKFWDMHDYIYVNQASLNNEDLFLGFAKSKLSLDEDKISREVDKHFYSPRIREDFLSGVRSGVNGTPTFFLNDRRHDGSYEFNSLTDAVDSLLRQ
ncbi:MAG: DsbA family protein [Nitrososphaerales archaeon]